MRIKDLIAKLEGLDQNMQILVKGHDHSYDEFFVFKSLAEKSGPNYYEAGEGEGISVSVMVIE